MSALITLITGYLVLTIGVLIGFAILSNPDVANLLKQWYSQKKNTNRKEK